MRLDPVDFSERTWQQYAEDYNNSGSTERYDLLDHLRELGIFGALLVLLLFGYLLYRLFVVAQNAGRMEC